MAEVRDAHLDEPQATAAAVPPSDVRRRASATSSRAFANHRTCIRLKKNLIHTKCHSPFLL